MLVESTGIFTAECFDWERVGENSQRHAKNNK